MIQTTFTLQKPDYIAAQRLYIRHTQRRSWWWRVPALMVLLVSLIVLPRLAEPGGSVFFTVTVAAGATIAVWAFTAILRPLMLGRRYKTEARLLKDVHLTLGEDGYTAVASGIGQGTTAWSAFDTWLEGKTVFVLIVGYMFRPIPKANLTGAEIDSVRTLLSDQVGPEGMDRIHASVND